MGAAILSTMLAVSVSAAETKTNAILDTDARNYDAMAETKEESESDLPENDVSTITADYSATKLAGREFPFPSIKAFSDVSCENELPLEFVDSGEDQVIYQFHRDDAPETIYLIPPIVPVTRKVEKTELVAPDGTAEPANGCYIKDVFVRKERGFLEKEPTWYEVYVIIDSETGEYPDNLIMKSDGKIYQGAQSVRFSSPDPATQTIDELSYHFKVSDDADAALEAFDHASFTYTRLVHYEAANDWDFSCEDAKLEIVEASVG